MEACSGDLGPRILAQFPEQRELYSIENCRLIGDDNLFSNLNTRRRHICRGGPRVRLEI